MDSPSSPRSDRQESSGETAATTISETLGSTKTHRPILLAAEAVAATEGVSRIPYPEGYIPELLSFAIEEFHPMVDAWPMIRVRILDHLSRSGVAWSGLGVLRRRQTLREIHEDTTVILVVQPDQSQEVLLDLEKKVYSVCTTAGHGELYVEIVEGLTTRFADEKYQQIVNSGSSVGPSWLNWVNGTLGGYVRLEDENGRSKIYGISCHHVLLPTNTGSTEFLPAVTPGHNQYLNVSQPSIMSRNDDVKDLERLCSTMQEDITLLEDQIPNEPWKSQGLETKHRLVAIYLAGLKAITTFNLHLGTVFASSGYAISGSGTSLDWALIDIEEARVGKNIVPSFSMRKPADYMALPEGELLPRTASLETDGCVVHSGCISEMEVGRLSHIKFDCNLPGNERQTKEYVVAGSKGRPFAVKGDSGAFVLNSLGELVGILVAGQEKLRVSYVTPIAQVFAHIEESTGCKVSLA